MKRGHFDSRAIFDGTSTNLLNSLADGDLGVDWLYSDNDVVFFERIEVFVEKSINENDISRVNCRLHRGPSDSGGGQRSASSADSSVHF